MSEMVKKISENPEMLQKALGMASALASSGALNGLLSGTSKQETSVPPLQPPPLTSDVPPEIPEKSSTGKPSSKDRIALLEAVRPFISAERRGNLDLLIRLISFLDLAESMGLGKLF
jgi:hypothetical protein